MKKTVFIILILFSLPFLAQKNEREIDSLETLMKSLHDGDELFTTQAALIKKYYRVGEFKKSEQLYKKACAKAAELNSDFGFGALFNVKGTIFYYQSDFDSALFYFEKAVSLREKINDADGILKSSGNLAGMYYMLGDYKKAIGYYEKALKREEELGFKEGSKVDLNNIASVYMSLKVYDKALALYRKMERSGKEDPQTLMSSYQGIGNVYDELNKLDSAFFYLNRARSLAGEIQDELSMSYILMDLGIVNKNLKKYDEALNNLNEALTLAIKYKDKRLQLGIYGNLAAVYIDQGQAQKVMPYIGSILQLQKELNVTTNRDDMAKLFAQYYYDKGEYEKAYNQVLLYERYKDSTYNIETTSQINDMQTKFETDKKERQNQLLQSQNKTHRTTRNYLALIVIIAFLGIIGAVVAYRQIKRSKKTLVYQKQLVEEKQKEILDSINYAKRIQFALLASDQLLSSNLPQHFVLFKPKDVVSGDFYWASPTATGFVYITADCTGHGVPGAFMSLLNISKLGQIVNEKKIDRPDIILNNMRSEIIKALSTDSGEQERKDGMDAVLCKLNHAEMKLEYAAANNSFYIVRNGTLLTCKADKMPVGRGHDDSISFTYNEIALQKDDIIYTFTDGYADQFGGAKGKKFMYKKLCELLLSICNYPMDIQREKLNESFESWKGDLEQVDDVCIIGVKV